VHILCTVVRWNGQWQVRIDNITKSESVSNVNDVQLYEKPAFIGGRPGRVRQLRAFFNVNDSSSKVCFERKRYQKCHGLGNLQ
jgi:hypothetical protein